MAKKQTKAKKKTSKASKAKKPKTGKSDAFEPDLSFIPIWSKKLKKDPEVLKEKLEEIASDLRTKHGDKWSDVKIYSTARRRLYGTFKADFRSSAAPFKGLLCYRSEAFDYGNWRYQKHIDLYTKNPREAMKKGMVKVEQHGRVKKPIPIYDNEETKAGKPNKFYGKPLPEHAWIQSIGGMAIPLDSYNKDEMEHLKPFEMTVSRSLADPNSKQCISNNLKIGSWVDFKATNRTAKENDESWELNATTMTKFTEDTELALDVDQIESYFEGFYVPLGELQEYHDSYMEENKEGTKQFSKRLVVAVGEVIDIVLSEDGTASHRVVLDDESIGFGDEDDEDVPDSITCWIDPEEEINFGKFSKVIVFGNTSAGLKKDLVTNEFLDEFNTPSIAVNGIIVVDLVEPELDDEEGGEAPENEEYEEEDTEEPATEDSNEDTDDSNDEWD